MKEKVRKLWELCFHDSPAFTDLYFQMRYNNEVNIAIQSGDMVIAALQMLPYPMTYCGKTIATSYVSGACTHPDFRNKGVMRELLAESFGKMHQKGILLSTLIPAEPWLFDYYAQSGYTTAFHYQTTIFHQTADCKLPSEYTMTVTNELTAAAYDYFEQSMHQRPCCIQHTAADLKVILADLQLSGGHIYTLYHTLQQEPIALAFAYPAKEGEWWIGELLANSEQEAQNLLQRICQTTQQDTLRLLHPVQEKEKSERLGMARIIDAHAMLQLYAAAHPETEWNLALTDEQLQANTGYYYLNNGHCMKSAKRLPVSHLALTIGELTAKILVPHLPYMSLMLN